MQSFFSRAMLAIAVVFALGSLSCASFPPPVPEDASARTIIQRAQERYDLYDLKGARYYYTLLLERYGSDPDIVLNATYELAFIDYKEGKKAKAIEGFRKVVARYGEADAATLDPTWKALADMMLKKLGATN
ncbi:MAG: hypothetical protein N2067_01950 [Spirochaetaceae bacterium]|nr:hypothetical protein [Spirochaetaceae bacterium]